MEKPPCRGAATRSSWAGDNQATVRGSKGNSALLQRTDFASGEIGRKRVGARFSIGQRHVSVRAHQVNGIASQAGASCLWTPGEDVPRQFVILAHGSDFRCSVPVYVNLPIQRS